MSLSKRFSSHKSDSVGIFSDGTKLYKRMREVGPNNWFIRPLLTLESTMCSRDEIRVFERMWCKILNADLNTICPSRSDAERYQQNKEVILRKKAEYRQNNREDILRKKAVHYRKNKEVILRKNAKRYQQNKEVILRKKAEYRQIIYMKVLIYEGLLYI